MVKWDGILSTKRATMFGRKWTFLLFQRRGTDYIGICMQAKLLQTCPTLCNTMECNLAVSSVHGDSPGKNTEGACHFLLQGYLSDPGIQPASLMSPALAGGFIIPSATWVEKAMATHSSVLAWRIPGMEEPWWAAIYGVTQGRTQLKWQQQQQQCYLGSPHI